MSFLSGSRHSIIVMLEPTFTHTLGQLELEMSIIERNLEDEVEVEVGVGVGVEERRIKWRIGLDV